MTRTTSRAIASSAPMCGPPCRAFARPLAATTRRSWPLDRRLLPAFARALDLPEDTFAPMFTKPTSNLRLLHYPAPEPGTNSERLRLGIGSHTDSECFTILHQTKPGLQVMSVGGEWIDVPPLPGSFVVNVGDTLETWTNRLLHLGPASRGGNRRGALLATLSSSPRTSTHGSSRSRPSSRPSGPRAIADSAPASTSSRSMPRASAICGSLHDSGVIRLATPPGETSRYMRAPAPA